METRESALLAAKALDDKRGKDITVLKVDEMTVITDYMVIATGRSVPQVKALADNVEEELGKLELDPKRRRHLLGRLRGIQTIVTCTDLSDLAEAEIGAAWRIQAGEIVSEGGDEA